MPNVYIILGSNIGNAFNTFHQAIKEIEKKTGSIIKTSSIYRTEPWEAIEIQIFHNQAVILITEIQPLPLLKEFEKIEKKFGRTEKGNTSPRTLDIDILFYDDLILKTDSLIIPHPLLHIRNFVLVPLSEIAHDFKHPIFNETIDNLLAKCTDNKWVDRID